MPLPKSLATSFLSLSAAAVLALAAAGGAAAAPDTVGDKKDPVVASLAVNGAGAADYWTSDRMLNAVPGEVLAGQALERASRPGAPAPAKGGTTKTKGNNGKGVSLESVSHVGKVFFTVDGSNYVCSGNAVQSFNRSTVSTAGHCVIPGPGQEATNFAFVPAFDNGAAPYGKWTARGLYTPTEWSSSGNINFDTAFAVMNPDSSGRLLTDVVGGSQVAFNQPRGLFYTSYGYPADKQFNGQTLKSCAGTASPDPINTAFSTQGIPCSMTGGASGGPWLIGNYPGRGGVQNSINSYGYSGSKVMYGPYWGPEIETTYNVAQIS
jgi:V8-like Glu-specific endopeptidase